MPPPTAPAASPFKQPKAVFAVAFACVVSFMGIGLVDPILPAISNQLHASPSETTLLFTSYLVVTAVAMLITNWVSSRIGAKWTMIAGLVLIVAFSALAGSSGSISEIIEFRAGWGIGNALFIATSLAVIVASASGGFAGAIVLYETALGLGIAVGPLVGGTLGEISWRGPFYGVAVLMAISLCATVVLVDKTPSPATRTSLSAPFKALRHRGLLTMALTALCYNWGFFTILGYAPFPMELSPIKLGLVFFGWGIMVAVFAVFGAPWLQRRLGIARTMYANLFIFALISLGIAIWTLNKPALIILVIVSGIVCGVNNTVTTQAVMTVSPVERPVASAAYSFVRFIGGGLAPYAAGRLVLAFNIHVPFYIGAGAILLGIVILSTGHKLLGEAERTQAAAAAAARRPRPVVARGGGRAGTRGRGEGRGPARRRRLNSNPSSRTVPCFALPAGFPGRGRRRGSSLGREVAGQECQRRRFLRGEELAVVAAVREGYGGRLAAGPLGQRAGEGPDAGVERVAEAGRDADRDAGERGGVGHRVVGREVGRRRVRPGVGRPRLGVAGPDGGADRGGRADQVRALLRQQQGAVAAHRDAHHADPLRGRPGRGAGTAGSPRR